MTAVIAEKGMKSGLECNSPLSSPTEADLEYSKNRIGRFSTTRPSERSRNCRGEPLSFQVGIVASASPCAYVPIAHAKATPMGRRIRLQRPSRIPRKFSVHLARGG